MPTLSRRLLISKPVSWREGAILIAVAWLVPFLVHLIPWAGPRPLGVYVLPVFWTTFIAVYFYGALPGLAIGLVAPLVNLAVTGLPALGGLGLMGMELALFVAIAAVLASRWPALWLAAPLAWIGAKTMAIALQFLIPLFGYAGDPVTHVARSMQNGLAGIGLLAVINWLLVAFCPKADAWERE